MLGTVFSGVLTDQLLLPCAAKLQFDVRESVELFDSYSVRCSVLPVELHTIKLDLIIPKYYYFKENMTQNS